MRQRLKTLNCKTQQLSRLEVLSFFAMQLIQAKQTFLLTLTYVTVLGIYLRQQYKRMVSTKSHCNISEVISTYSVYYNKFVCTSFH